MYNKPIISLKQIYSLKKIYSLKPNNKLINFNTVINLIGNPNNVNNAANEIKLLLQEKNINTKIILYDDGKLLNIMFTTYNIIINKCNLISCNKLNQINKIINWGLSEHWNSYTFQVEINEKSNLVICNEVNKIYLLNTCINTKKNYLKLFY
jgi:hypothetical protein